MEGIQHHISSHPYIHLIQMIGNDDQRLSSLISKGLQGDVVILGCPFDYARRRSIKKGGEDNGPDCLRRFYHKVGPLINAQYEIDITRLKVSDMGNVHLPKELYEHENPQQAIQIITSNVSELLKECKLPFIIGGSKQASLGSIRAFQKEYPEGMNLVIAGKPFLKRPYDNDKLTSDNLLTILENEFPRKQVLFGAHSRYFPRQTQAKFKYHSYQEIHAVKIDKLRLGRTTHARVKLEEVLEGETVPLHVTLSVEAIERFLGCRDMQLFGLTNEEMLESFFLLGQSSRVKCISIVEFNPSCQDYQSSLLLLNLFYYFLMGRAMQPQK